MVNRSAAAATSGAGRANITEIEDIGRRHKRFVTGRPGGARAIFSFYELIGLDLSECDLSEADFTGAKLRQSRLCDAKLRRANFFCADLRLANLERADLRGARRADRAGAGRVGAVYPSESSPVIRVLMKSPTPEKRAISVRGKSWTLPAPPFRP